MLLDSIDDLLNNVHTDRSLFTGLFQAIEDFEAIEELPPSVFLNHHGKGFLCPLTGRKSLLTAKAFPPSSNRFLVLAEARVHHFAFRMIAEGTFHGFPHHLERRGSKVK